MHKRGEKSHPNEFLESMRETAPLILARLADLLDARDERKHDAEPAVSPSPQERTQLDAEQLGSGQAQTQATKPLAAGPLASLSCAPPQSGGSSGPSCLHPMTERSANSHFTTRSPR